MQGLGRDRDTTFFIVMLESSFVHTSIAAPHFSADYDTVVVPMVPSISVIFLLWQCIVQVSYKGSQRALSLSPFKKIRSHVWTLTWLEKSRIPAPSHPIHSSQSSQQSSPTPMNPSRLSERSSSNSPNCKVLLLSRLYTHTHTNETKNKSVNSKPTQKQKWEEDN